ncbi:MAG TPA: ferredoxin family protein [Anaerolineales bacterium]|nr:ferredoxin family protein [Anaerolineales bacterium]
MTHVITSLCLRDDACSDVCPVACIQPGKPTTKFPNYYIDPATCIDCGACIPECPYKAIFPEDEVPAAFPPTAGRCSTGQAWPVFTKGPITGAKRSDSRPRKSWRPGKSWI